MGERLKELVGGAVESLTSGVKDADQHTTAADAATDAATDAASDAAGHQELQRIATSSCNREAIKKP
ncbi:hypothetical protein HaLaN_17625 [Haematococcus lacustris]|uniref:Uncharacterized protein n=1 Tax=Haematococcus lacustris TaxID=44745 RepID=A0A699ZF27_HAELA|nr:hypothetical protein HaLaN_17625 [Haematococcus lacustris]